MLKAVYLSKSFYFEVSIDYSSTAFISLDAPSDIYFSFYKMKPIRLPVHEPLAVHNTLSKNSHRR